MEFGSSENAQDKSNIRSKHENQPDPSAVVRKPHTFRMNDVLTPDDTFGEVNAEVTVHADEVMRAGGFGATDDLSSILPIASDFTDFEDHLLKAHAYEDVLEGGADNTEENAFGAVNMEASATSDEVMRAGGFGAKDDISSFLPVASDFTDFEANLRGAREYEDLSEEIHRPGLGWTSESR